MFLIFFLAIETPSGRKVWVWSTEDDSVRFWPRHLARIGKLGLLKKRPKILY